MSKNTRQAINTIFRIAQFGDFLVYQRGYWARRAHLPRYVVMRDSTGSALEEFRRKKAALIWAEEAAAGRQRERSGERSGGILRAQVELRDIVNAITRFDRHTAATEYTDSGTAWELLNSIRRASRRVLRGLLRG